MITVEEIMQNPKKFGAMNLEQFEKFRNSRSLDEMRITGIEKAQSFLGNKMKKMSYYINGTRFKSMEACQAQAVRENIDLETCPMNCIPVKKSDGYEIAVCFSNVPTLRPELYLKGMNLGVYRDDLR